MLDHDAPLERARSQLSIGTLDSLLRPPWNKLANIGDSPLLQDESSLIKSTISYLEAIQWLASILEVSSSLTVDPGSVMPPGGPEYCRTATEKTGGGSGITRGSLE